ncbi:MAG: DNA repair protein RecN [Chloroflexi bacterium]|nr:DNA repair protein RecN [Chloroflexota bacterium]
MLSELHITDFAIIDRLSLPFSPAFNVITGETGAGKSIIVDALAALLGGRADGDLVRTGRDSARVEGVFLLQPSEAALVTSLTELLETLAIEAEDGALILSREINRSGRGAARINGRPVVLSALREVGEHLVDIHGQGEHLSLLKQSRHIDYLDSYAGLLERRAELAKLVGELRAVRREMDALVRDERELARRSDLLRHESQEIAGAALRPGEEEELNSEHKLLGNAEERARLSYAAFSAIQEGAGDAALLEQVEQLAGLLRDLGRLDPRLKPEQERAAGLALELADLAASLRSYHEAVEFDPTRLRAVEERLELIHRLKRKYGATIKEVLAFGERAAAELEEMSHAEERSGALAARERELLGQIGVLAGELSAQRRLRAEGLARAIEAEMAHLDLQGGRFAVDLTQTPATDGVVVTTIADAPLAFDAGGVDRVEFMVSMNSGEPLRPLVKVASGGETSRLMLALKCVLHQADATGTLVFDEVDAGLGGVTARRVGERMAYLAGQRQVVCISHLPQLACFADSHIAITKHETGGRAIVEATALSPEQRIEEMARLLGHHTDAARKSAQEMLRLAQEYKQLNTAGTAAL